MRHTEIEFDSFNGSSANGYSGKFNLQLPSGITYKEITLHGVNLNDDQIKRVSLSLNGDSLIDVNGEVLRIIQRYKSNYIESGKWVIPFADFSMLLQEGQNLTSLVTLPGENVILEVETDTATAAQIAASDVASIRVEGILGISQNQRLTVPRIYRDVMNGGVAGENRFKNFVNQNRTTNPVRVRRAHLLDANVTKFEIKRNGITLFDKTLEDQNYSLRRFGRSPESGIYHFDAVKTGYGVADPLRTQGSTFEMIVTKSAPADFEAIFETLEILPAVING
jgi:Viral coat protein P2 N-terminal domain